MNNGYRMNPGSTIPEFLNLAGTWETLHTSGHASSDDMKIVIEKTDPLCVIPIHSERPDLMQTLFPDRNIILPADGQEVEIK